jgi:hypothetical protein
LNVLKASERVFALPGRTILAAWHQGIVTRNAVTTAVSEALADGSAGGGRPLKIDGRLDVLCRSAKRAFGSPRAEVTPFERQRFKNRFDFE